MIRTEAPVSSARPRATPAMMAAFAALFAAACGPAPYTLPPDEPPTVQVAEAPQVEVEPQDRDHPEPSAPANPFAEARTWVGSYHCPQGRTELTLRITGVRGSTVRAVFEFNHPPSGAAGSYMMSGRFDKSGNHIVFEPGAWIDQPENYVSVGMDGSVSRESMAFTGIMTHPDCGTFSLRATR